MTKFTPIFLALLSLTACDEPIMELAHRNLEVGPPQLVVPSVGALWGRCKGGKQCAENLKCDRMYSEQDLTEYDLTICVPARDSDECRDWLLHDECVDAEPQPANLCGLPCTAHDDCRPDVGMLCGTRGYCAWQF